MVINRILTCDYWNIFSIPMDWKKSLEELLFRNRFNFKKSILNLYIYCILRKFNYNAFIKGKDQFLAGITVIPPMYGCNALGMFIDPSSF